MSLGAASSGKGSMEPKGNKCLNGMKGKSNCFGGSVDLGLLPRIPKGLQVLVARMVDLGIFSLATMDERDWKPQSTLVHRSLLS
jgi:hypothetical protein